MGGKRARVARSSRNIGVGREEEAGMHRAIRLHRCTSGQVIAPPGIPEDRD